MTATNETLINNPPRDITDLTIIGLDELEKRAVQISPFKDCDTLYRCLIQDLTFRLLAEGWDKDELKDFCSETVDDSQKNLSECERTD
mgnify:CR=1 FL=1